MDRGAHFHKCDFQVHTPRDTNWKGTGAVTDDERRAYAVEFVAACRERRLQAVAITDHHDFAFVPYIRRAAAEELARDGTPLADTDRLIVFPGLELTLAVPCQALLLLDADFPDEWLGVVLTALAINPESAASAKHAPVQRLRHIDSFEALYAALETQPVLKGRFIVFPNVGENGNFSMIRDGFAPKYAAMPCVGGYLDGSITRLREGTKVKIEGRTKEWGPKALGLFQTSDNRDRSFAQLGTAHTWVKWAKPTAEALRQACLARHSRISQERPTLPTVRILRLEVTNSKFLGPITIEFNGQYNALIGGRGTGKSSVLEYLRWALCDQPPSTIDDELPDFQKRRASLIEKTLTTLDGSVQVTVMVNETEHTVRRHTDGRILLRIGDGEFGPITESEVRTLLPIQGYSQKQLSSVGIKGDELRRFVDVPVRSALEAVGSKLAAAAGQIRAVHEVLREHRRLTDENAGARTELRSIEEQLNALRQTLGGMTEEDRAVIEAQPRWEEEGRVITTWRQDANDAVTELQKLTTRLRKLPTPFDASRVNDAKRMGEIRSSFGTLFAAALQELSAADDILTGNGEERQQVKTAIESWQALEAVHKAKYEAARERAAQHADTLRQIAVLEARHRELLSAITERERRLAELGEPETKYQDLLSTWRKLHDERFRVLQEQCVAVTALSKDVLRASVLRARGIEPLANQLRDVAKGTRIRSDKIDALLESVTQDLDPVKAWLEVVAELRSLAEMDIPSSGVLPACPRLGSAQITEVERRKIAEKLAPRGWADFAVLELEDTPVFEYRARPGDYIAFADASAGQQATALMFVLLNQPGPPLVVDQPEDDLDNHVISEVVRELWSAKSRRQLIFTSHNANLVVNGDAELVIGCAYRTTGDQSGGEIKLQGAIDMQDVRAEIAEVMEGGKAAFNLRREKYGF